MRDAPVLQGKMTLDLSNARAIDNLLTEVFTGLRVQYLSSRRHACFSHVSLSFHLKQGKERADVALKSTIPQITQSLDQDLCALDDLEQHLPEVGRQVRDIKNVYDSGRNKVCWSLGVTWLLSLGPHVKLLNSLPRYRRMISSSP